MCSLKETYTYNNELITLYIYGFQTRYFENLLDFKIATTDITFSFLLKKNQTVRTRSSQTESPRLSRVQLQRIKTSIIRHPRRNMRQIRTRNS